MHVGAVREVWRGVVTDLVRQDERELELVGSFSSVGANGARGGSERTTDSEHDWEELTTTRVVVEEEREQELERRTRRNTHWLRVQGQGLAVAELNKGKKERMAVVQSFCSCHSWLMTPRYRMRSRGLTVPLRPSSPSLSLLLTSSSPYKSRPTHSPPIHQPTAQPCPTAKSSVHLPHPSPPPHDDALPIPLLTRISLSQPHVYRTIMNDVVENVRPEFDELGVEEAVLNELLRSWESKVAQSRVADFTTDLRMAPVAVQFPMLPNPLPGTTAAAAAPPSAAGSSKAGVRSRRCACG